MIKCLNPNYVRIIEDPFDKDAKKKVLFAPGGKREYNEQFKKEYLDPAGYVEVPCGKCVACKLEYSRTWANRCYLESLCHPVNWFITLTYRDDQLKFGYKGFATLEKDALSDFIRKLRDHFGHQVKIRFFGCGEYGSKTMRPHYHLIVFGAPISDLTIDIPDYSKAPLKDGRYPIFRRKNSNGDYVFYSQTVYDCWKKGKIEIEECSWNTAAYVSRYVMKKQNGLDKGIYDRLGLVPEYLRMSNRPGIGADWLIYNKDKLLRFDYLSVKNKNGAQTSRPPRYFTKLMLKNDQSVDAALMEANKIQRVLNAKRISKESLTTKNLGVQMQDKGSFIEKKSKLLQRDFD